jgi:hypothetical protein
MGRDSQGHACLMEGQAKEAAECWDKGRKEMIVTTE